MSKNKKILLISFARGDEVLLSYPLIKAVKENIETSRIDILTLLGGVAYAELLDGAEKVFAYDNDGRHKGFLGMYKLTKTLSEEKYDIALCTGMSDRAAIIARMAGIKERIGYDTGKAGFFLTKKLSLPSEDEHEVKRQLRLLKMIGIEAKECELEVVISKKHKEGYYKKKERYALSSMGYMALIVRGSYKKKFLSQATAAHLVRRLKNYRRGFYLLGDDEDCEMLEKIAELGGLPFENVLAGKLTVGEKAVFLSHADMLVSVDTGDIHLAEALGCPQIALFGPMSPKVYGSRRKDDANLYEKIPCSPCLAKGVCRDNDCLANISAREIIKELEAKLEI